jgi:hypothetical protein
MMKYFVSFLLWLPSLSYAGTDQAPPLNAEPFEECHIADAIPLLDKAQYNTKAEYSLKTLQKNPLILLESIKLEDGGTLKIEQRGCEDVYFKFQYAPKQKAKDKREQIKQAAEAVAKLKVATNALTNSKELQEIMGKVKVEIAKAPPANEFVVCTMSIPSECVNDVKVTAASSGNVEFFYVERP